MKQVMTNPKRGHFALCIVHCALFLFIAFTAMAQKDLVVGTYNIRLLVNSDEQKGEVWRTRCKVMCDQMNFEAPDAFGAQEVTHPQLVDMLQQLDGYDYTGVGRDDGKEAGEYSCIFYKKDRMRLLDSGTFWLSETPEQVSYGWDAACRRVCSWGKFKMRKGGFTFFFFNLHMDHVGVIARREAAKLVVDRIRTIAKGAPVILTGDFNVDQTNEIFRTFSESGILKDSYAFARQRFAENGTYIAFDPNLKTEQRIDHIFVSPRFTVNHYGILTDGYWTPDERSIDADQTDNGPAEVRVKTYRRHTPSDHYPVIAKISYQ